MRRWALALMLLPGWLAATGASRRPDSDPQPYTVSEWRDWFRGRRFGEDPYFFFARNEQGATGCPQLTRLTLTSADSTGIRLDVDPDQAPESEARFACRVLYAELRDHPTQSELEPGRTMWRLVVGAGDELGARRERPLNTGRRRTLAPTRQ